MSFRVRMLAPDSPINSFPNPATAGVALGYPDGLLAIGGDLSTARLLAAYGQGIFPWYNDDQPILWWSPDPRAVIETRRFHMSRSLARTLRRGEWAFSLNQNFADVIDGCATERDEHGTWITADMRAAYLRLHELGYAHSVESWCEQELVGGIYGIRLGKIFFGESMFSRVSNASKVALSGLIHHCLDTGIELLDAQVESAHLQQFGLQQLSRDRFTSRVRRLATAARPLPDWEHAPQQAAPLAELRRSS